MPYNHLNQLTVSWEGLFIWQILRFQMVNHRLPYFFRNGQTILSEQTTRENGSFGGSYQRTGSHNQIIRVSPRADLMSSGIKPSSKRGRSLKSVNIAMGCYRYSARPKGFGDVKRLVGYSLGSHLAASAAKHAPGEVSLSQLSLLEAPVISKG